MLVETVAFITFPNLRAIVDKGGHEAFKAVLKERVLEKHPQLQEFDISVDDYYVQSAGYHVKVGVEISYDRP